MSVSLTICGTTRPGVMPGPIATIGTTVSSSRSGSLTSLPVPWPKSTIGSGPAPTGSKWVESRNGQMTVRVLWDDKGQYPRRVESSHARGTSRSVTVATPEALPKPLPWDRLQGYAQKEYSDLLD